MGVNMMCWIKRVIVFGACLVGSAIASGAQEPALTETDLPRVENPLVAPDSALWERGCLDENDDNSCRIVQNLFLERDVDGTKERIGRVLQVIVLYSGHPETNERVPFISMNLPLGIDLRPGAVVKIDDGPERNFPYLQCVNDGCAISSMLDGELLEQMQLGNQLFVGFRAWGNMETTVIPASLIGFSRAFNTLQ